MPCYQPLRVGTDEDGRLDWSNYDPTDTADAPVMVPCRKCVGCMRKIARDWSIRCYHEATLHTEHFRDPVTGLVTELPKNVMITLTYSDENLPEFMELNRKDLLNFLRRLGRRRGESPRYFAAGEYGGSSGRCHFHVILFNESFDDRYEAIMADGQTLSMSYELDELWRLGIASIDDLNFQTARYVAGYVAKKNHDQRFFTGPLVEEVNVDTGETFTKPLEPEFRLMSRHPGLGRAWIEANYERVYPADQVVIDGHEFPPPGYYDQWLRKHHPELYLEIQSVRYDQRVEAQVQWTPQRCAAAEQIAMQNLRRDKF